jgi:hypothetical protein
MQDWEGSLSVRLQEHCWITLKIIKITDLSPGIPCAAAMACNADVIVSRNVKDYQNSPIRTVTPELLLQELR